MNSILQLSQSKVQEKKTNPFSKLYESIESNESNVNDSKSKLTIKDLCPEDKTRIANLIKELAKYKMVNKFIK